MTSVTGTNKEPEPFYPPDFVSPPHSEISVPAESVFYPSAAPDYDSDSYDWSEVDPVDGKVLDPEMQKMHE